MPFDYIITDNFTIDNFGLYSCYIFPNDDRINSYIIYWDMRTIRFYSYIRPVNQAALRYLIVSNNLSVDWSGKLSFFEMISINDIVSNIQSEDKRIIFGKFYKPPSAIGVDPRIFVQFLNILRAEHQRILYTDWDFHDVDSI